MNDWYFLLIKPPLTPPASVFTPAWGLLYTTVIIALLIFVSKNTENDKSCGLWLFWLQMLFNFLWAPVFFGLKNILFALIIIIALDILVLLTIKEFYKTAKTSGLILIPYMLWLLFATYLNAGLFLLNR